MGILDWLLGKKTEQRSREEDVRKPGASSKMEPPSKSVRSSGPTQPPAQVADVLTLTDQATLAEIAKTGKTEAIRTKAVENEHLVDQRVLADVAKNDTSWAVSEVAAKRLTDQALLSEVAKGAIDNLARLAAVQKLEDNGLLAQIALADEDDVVRRAAARALQERTPIGQDELRRIDSASGQENGLLPRCGGCGVTDRHKLGVVVDKNGNRGFLCDSCKREYLSLLRTASSRRFWKCGRCNFRILAGTKIDAAVDPQSLCPNCGADVNMTLVNLNADQPVASGAIGEPLK